MADSNSSKSSSISGSDYLDFEASVEGEHNERVYESVGEFMPWQFEPPGRTKLEIERKSQRRIHSPCAAAASIKKARMVSAFTIINEVSQNQSLINIGAIK